MSPCVTDLRGRQRSGKRFSQAALVGKGSWELVWNPIAECAAAHRSSVFAPDQLCDSRKNLYFLVVFYVLLC